MYNHHLPSLNSNFNRRQQQQKIRTVTKICIIFNVKSLKEQAILLQLGAFLCFNCFDIRNSGFLFIAQPKILRFSMPVCNLPTAGSFDFDKSCSCSVPSFVCFDKPMLAEAFGVNFPV